MRDSASCTPLDPRQARGSADPIHATKRYSHQERIGKNASHPPQFSLSLHSSVAGTDAVPDVFMRITHPPQVPFLRHGDLRVRLRYLLRPEAVLEYMPNQLRHRGAAFAFGVELGFQRGPMLNVESVHLHCSI